MPSLVLEHADAKITGTFSGRVTIGRSPLNGVVVDDASISRIHAWIDLDASPGAGHYYIADTGSRTGTLVNGRPVYGKVQLVDGDEITLGPARLVFNDRHHATAAPIHAHFGRDSVRAVQDGILFNCSCGAPIWVQAAYAGGRGVCRHCKQRIQIPHLAHKTTAPSPAKPRPANGATPAPAKRRPPSAEKPAVGKLGPEVANLKSEISDLKSTTRPPAAPAQSKLKTQKSKISTPSATCSICQWQVMSGEETTRCPSCGLTFHADCWTENCGCSAYGCDQVNVLHPDYAAQRAARAEAVAAGAEAIDIDDLTPGARAPLPWEFVLLAASVFAALAALLTFGATSLLAGVATVLFAHRNPDRRRDRPVLFAAAISAAGVAAGLYTSYHWWLSGGR